MRRDGILRSLCASKVDIAWAMFVALNLIAMQLVPGWRTIPFLIIWVSLTAMYGFRLWRMGSTIITVAAVTLATGGLIGWQVLRGQEDAEYLAEVPLVATMFVVMVWHARRRQGAMEETKRVSDENRLLLDQQRRFLQDASHELGTPITIALGHTQLIGRTATDPLVTKDAGVAVNELLRLRRLTGRLLLLASAERQDFVQLVPIEVDDLVLDALNRWGHIARSWSVGDLEDATVAGDWDRLVVALDALIENAVEYTNTGGRIELSARREAGNVVLAVADSGSGIRPAEISRIFDRFSRGDSHRDREKGGFGLGLSIAKAIVEAHYGSIRVRSAQDRGSVFELLVPESEARADQRQRARRGLSTTALRPRQAHVEM